MRGSGTPEDPWVLRTPPGTSEFTIHRDDAADPAELVCQVDSTKIRYLARGLDDVPAMLRANGDWMDLGSAGESKPAKDGTLESWARSEENPVGGWYGLRNGYRGRVAMNIRPLLEELGLVGARHNPRVAERDAVTAGNLVGVDAQTTRRLPAVPAQGLFGQGSVAG